MKSLRLWQFLFDNFILSAPLQYGLWCRLKFTVGIRLRKFIVNYIADPTVKYDLDGTQILLPLSHDLPLIRSMHPDYSRNLARIALMVHQKYPDMCVVDIGANVGDTVAILRKQVNCPVLCIDGDRYFYSILEENARAWSRVELECAFVGGDGGAWAGSMVRSGGSGHLTEESGSNSRIALKQLRQILNAHPNFAKFRLIKIDTDGFDCQILMGNATLLADLKPVLYFEYDPFYFERVAPESKQVFERLYAVGYQYALFFENTGEYFLHAELANTELLEEIHRFYSGRQGKHYCDICLFHKDDSELFLQVRRSEMELPVSRER